MTDPYLCAIIFSMWATWSQPLDKSLLDYLHKCPPAEQGFGAPIGIPYLPGTGGGAPYIRDYTGCHQVGGGTICDGRKP